MQNPNDEDELEIISKSAQKRETHQRQAVGQSLVELTAAQIKRMDLPEDLREAVLTAQTMPQRGARKRQLQFIGKIMRNVDPEPITQQLADLKGESSLAIQRQHQAETWRERLLSDGNDALTEFMSEFRSAESQRLRQLINSAQQEAKAEKPPRAARELFRYVRDLISAAD